MQKVRTFERATEPTFPENDALPKKEEEGEKFDKKMSEWYDDVKLNLDRLQDQFSTFYLTDINDRVEIQQKATGQILNTLNSNLITFVTELNDTLRSTKENLYSE